MKQSTSIWTLAQLVIEISFIFIFAHSIEPNIHTNSLNVVLV